MSSFIYIYVASESNYRLYFPHPVVPNSPTHAFIRLEATAPFRLLWSGGCDRPTPFTIVASSSVEVRYLTDATDGRGAVRFR